VRLSRFAPGNPEPVAVPEPQDRRDDKQDHLVDRTGNRRDSDRREASQPAWQSAVAGEQAHRAYNSFHAVHLGAESGDSVTVTAPRAVLVTGASRGIGAAVARAFAAAGDSVAVHYGANAGKAEAVAASLPGGGHVVVGADLSDAVAVRRMVDEAAASLGGLDVLVNNAGMFEPHPITETTYEEWQRAWQRTLAVNLVGAANATWCAVQHMVRGGGGRIVNVSSRGAFRGEPRQPAYGASKAALIAFGQSLARALGPLGISVTSVAPGITETDMAVDALAGEGGEARRAESPFGRVATAEEVAAAVLFLASPEAEFASGAVLDLNGASYLRM
jgi:NAD(P)-dependent dehydrogenase (short-subunit alcohol dehydrogenase family)